MNESELSGFDHPHILGEDHSEVYFFHEALAGQHLW